ncbi:MAG: SPOR domain-containing protein, partial [Magnetococcales bacterium]|nr:SPOR domain-containing protein [Magnetococcales bacterium]
AEWFTSQDEIAKRPEASGEPPTPGIASPPGSKPAPLVEKSVINPPVTPNEWPSGGVREAVNGWREAWIAQDINRFLSFYAPRYNYLSDREWQLWLQQTILDLRQSQSIHVVHSNLSINPMQGNMLRVDLIEDYHSQIRQSRQAKSLAMQKTAAGWKIVAEVSGPVPKVEARPTIYAIQVGAFPDARQADDLVAALQKAGYAPYIVREEIQSANAWRSVRIGRFSSRNHAKLARLFFTHNTPWKQAIITQMKRLASAPPSPTAPPQRPEERPAVDVTPPTPMEGATSPVESPSSSQGALVSRQRRVVMTEPVQHSAHGPDGANADRDIGRSARLDTLQNSPGERH